MGVITHRTGSTGTRVRRVAAAFAAGAAALLVATAMTSALAVEPAASSAEAFKLPAVLRVGITPNYPPIAFERGGAIVGIEPDLAAALSKELGVKFELQATAWDELREALLDRRIDVVMSGVSITESRQKIVAFTNPYGRLGQMALIRKADMGKRSDPASMNQKGSRVGVERLTTGARYAEETLDQATIVQFGSIDAGIAALRGGKIDYFIHDAPTVWRVSGRFDEADDDLIGLYRMLTDEQVAWAVRKEDAPTIGAALNGALAKLQADGTVQAILDRWVTVRKVTREMAPEPIGTPGK